MDNGYKFLCVKPVIFLDLQDLCLTVTKPEYKWVKIGVQQSIVKQTFQECLPLSNCLEGLCYYSNADVLWDTKGTRDNLHATELGRRFYRSKKDTKRLGWLYYCTPVFWKWILAGLLAVLRFFFDFSFESRQIPVREASRSNAAAQLAVSAYGKQSTF